MTLQTHDDRRFDLWRNNERAARRAGTAQNWVTLRQVFVLQTLTLG